MIYVKARFLFFKECVYRAKKKTDISLKKNKNSLLTKMAFAINIIKCVDKILKMHLGRIAQLVRAPALQAGGHRFESYYAHQVHFKCGPVVQLVRMPACHAGGHRFEPGSGRHVCFLTIFYICWRGSMAEQLICNQQVVGSTPIASSILWRDSRVAKGGGL